MATDASCSTARLSSATPDAARPETALGNMPDRGPNNERAAPRPRHWLVNRNATRRETETVFAGWDWASETHDITGVVDDGDVVDRSALRHPKPT